MANPASGSNNKAYAFVSSGTSMGDMTGFVFAACSGTGIQRADCACNEMAKIGGLTNSTYTKFIAWLSEDNNFVRCRFNGNSNNSCTPPSGGPTWYNTLDQPIAVGFGGLLGGSLINQLKYTEFRLQSPQSSAWTGTAADGSGVTGAANNCSAWIGGSNGVKGDIGANTTLWSQSTTAPCSSSFLPIYCFAVP